MEHAIYLCTRLAAPWTGRRVFSVGALFSGDILQHLYIFADGLATYLYC